MQSQINEEGRSSELKSIFLRMVDQRAGLGQLINQLERTGHLLKNTSVPEKKMAVDEPMTSSTGLISDMSKNLELNSEQLARFEMELKKLSDLI